MYCKLFSDIPRWVVLLYCKCVFRHTQVGLVIVLQMCFQTYPGGSCNCTANCFQTYPGGSCYCTANLFSDIPRWVLLLYCKCVFRHTRVGLVIVLQMCFQTYPGGSCYCTANVFSNIPGWILLLYCKCVFRHTQVGLVIVLQMCFQTCPGGSCYCTAVLLVMLRIRFRLIFKILASWVLGSKYYIKIT